MYGVWWEGVEDVVTLIRLNPTTIANLAKDIFSGNTFKAKKPGTEC